MNIVILTGRFGMGHIKAAEAIKEEILTQNSENKVDIVDFMDYMFPAISPYIYKGFNFLVSRCSGLYNAMNKSASNTGQVPLKVTVTRKIDKLIEEHQADAIVVAFPVCSQYISAYKKMRRCSIPLYTYITDITAHKEWIAAGTDRYFVGDETTKNTLISRGVPAEKITISGIPVRQCFKNTKSNKALERKEILIMGGGLGLIPSSKDFLKGLNENKNVKVTLIAGKNQQLLNEVQRKYKNIEAIGYTNEVEKYMARANVLVSKAGGITTFEAMATKTPLYIIKPFLEQEFGNAKYIEEHNIGRVLWDKEADESEDIISFIENDQLLKAMTDNMVRQENNLEREFIYTGRSEVMQLCC